jgi:uncharacterized protein YtpQ (UPF0354 family)
VPVTFTLGIMFTPMRVLVLSFVVVFAFPSVTRAQPVPLDESQFTEYVATRLRKEVGDASVVVKGPLTLGLGELQANLDRVFAFCRRERASCEPELDRYVKGAAEAHKDRTAPPQRDAVRVIVRPVQYAQAAQASFGGQGAQIQPRHFVDGMISLPVLDSPRTVRILGSKDNTQLGLSEAEVYELGLRNLRATLKPLMDVAKVAGSGQIGQIVGDTYDPSRLLLHDTWEPLAKAQGGKLIVALPATDALFYIGEDTPMAIEALRALVRNGQSRVPNRLSDVVLRWTEGGWMPVR